MKWIELFRNIIAKAVNYHKTEAYERRIGERSRLETGVVQSVNDDFYTKANAFDKLTRKKSTSIVRVQT